MYLPSFLTKSASSTPFTCVFVCEYVLAESVADIRLPRDRLEIDLLVQRLVARLADGGGKTGTAQWGGSGLDLPTHAWFLFFAPYAQPEIAMSIFVEQGGTAEVQAAPIGVDIMMYYNANQAAIRTP